MTVLAHRLQAVLRVHPGEGRTLALAVAVAFLADAAIMIAQSSIDALFFARYGVEKLPMLYLLVGIAMFLTTVGVGALLARVGRERVFVVIPAAISVAALRARGRRGRGHLGVRRSGSSRRRRVHLPPRDLGARRPRLGHGRQSGSSR